MFSKNPFKLQLNSASKLNKFSSTLSVVNYSFQQIAKFRQISSNLNGVVGDFICFRFSTAPLCLPCRDSFGSICELSNGLDILILSKYSCNQCIRFNRLLNYMINW